MSFLDLIFPKKCLECKKEGKYICKDCLRKVPPGGWTDLGEINVYSIWRYKGVIRKAVIALKYKFATEIASELAELALKNLNLRRKNKAILVPIPLYWYKRNFRGFNQSEEVGKAVAKGLGWEFIPDFIIKTKSTPSQAELGREKRLFNLRGVFSLNPQYKIQDYKEIVVFDDVLTTGSTLKEAVKALEGGMVRKIWGLTIAK